MCPYEWMHKHYGLPASPTTVRAHYKRPIIQINGDVNFARRTNAEALIYYNKNINQMLNVFDLLNEIFKYLCVLGARVVVCCLCMLILILDAENWALNILLEQMAIFAYQ